MTEPVEMSLIWATGAAALATGIAVVSACRGYMRWRAESEAPPLPEELAPEDEGGVLLEGGDSNRYGALGRAFRPTEPEEMSALRRQLSQAGRRGEAEVEIYSAIRAGTMLVGALFFLLLVVTLKAKGLLFGGLVLGCAYFGPVLWLRSRVKGRQHRLSLALPSALDLLVTCMEAGLGLEHALARVAGEIGISEAEMADELSMVVGEIRTGLSVGASFRKLASRVTSDEMRALCTVVVQSAGLGAPLGRALREYAASARRRRILALDETAGRITASLTLPLTLCLLPAAILAILGPAVVMISKTIFD
jgi:tight adherence protein C